MSEIKKYTEMDSETQMTTEVQKSIILNKLSDLTSKEIEECLEATLDELKSTQIELYNANVKIGALERALESKKEEIRLLRLDIDKLKKKKEEIFFDNLLK